MAVCSTVLPNGMKVVTDTMDGVRSISLGLWFSVGSRDEHPDQAGLTHFMEHMMFKGTPTRSPFDISMHFDRLGAELNAFTTKEYTCYYSRFVDDKLESALRVLSDMVVNSLFDQGSIDTEREVVIEEIARSEDTPDDYVFELYSQGNLSGHPLGLPVLGNRERVGSYVHKDCAYFHAEHYHAGNLVLAASGHVDHDSLVSLAERLFSSIPAGHKTQRVLAKPAYHAGVFAQKRTIEQAHLVLGYPWIPVGDERRYAGAVLTTVLGGSMSSRLFQEVREKRGLAYSIYASQAAYLDAGQWCVYAGTRPANAAEVISLVNRELLSICTDRIPDDELSRTVDLICGQFLLGLESTNAHMVRMGKSETLGVPQVSADEQIERYRLVTADEVRNLAQEMFSGDLAVAVVSPFDKSEIEEFFA